MLLEHERMLLEHEGYNGLGMGMLLEHEQNCDLGMDALGTRRFFLFGHGFSRHHTHKNTNGIAIWAWMLS